MQYPDLKQAKEIRAARDLVDGTPFDASNLLEACAATGLDPKHVKLMLKRMRARVVPSDSSVEAFRADKVAQLLGEKAQVALGYIDDYSMSTATVKELATVVDVLIKNKQLLEGQPTQIIDINDRRQLMELLPFIQQEAARRVIDITPPDAE